MARNAKTAIMTSETNIARYLEGATNDKEMFKDLITDFQIQEDDEHAHDINDENDHRTILHNMSIALVGTPQSG